MSTFDFKKPVFVSYLGLAKPHPSWYMLPVVRPVSIYFPGKLKYILFFQGQILENNIQTRTPGNREESDGSHFSQEWFSPSSMLSSKTASATTKRHVGSQLLWEASSLLSREECGVLSEQYHPDIETLCLPGSSCKNGNWSDVSKTWTPPLPGGISLSLSNFSKWQPSVSENVKIAFWVNANQGWIHSLFPSGFSFTSVCRKCQKWRTDGRCVNTLSR